MSCTLGNGIAASMSLASDSFRSFSPTSVSYRHVSLCRMLPAGHKPLGMKHLRAYEGGDGGANSGGGVGGSGGGGGGSGDSAYGKSGGIGLLGSLWARYMELLDGHPLITKSLTAGVFNLLADLICQVFLDKVQQIDIQRLLSFSAIGIFMSGPGLHIWYGILAKVVTVPGYGGVLLRLAADQLFFTPLGIGCFFIALCTLEGRQHEIEAKLRKDWFPLVVSNWKVWLPFQLINFAFIPSQLQVAATSFMGMAWTIFVSFIGHN